MFLLFSFNCINVVISTSKSPYDNVLVSENIGIIKAIPFNNTILSSLTIDPISDLVYVSGMPDYSYNYSCVEQIMNSSDVSGFVFPCSTIYILDGDTGQINNSIKLRPGEIIHDMTIDPRSGKIYAAGEYNYLENSIEPIQYEDDVVFIINQTSFTNNTNYNLSQQSIHSNDIQRIRLYGEEEEGKEGDMSSIAVDTHTDTIYAGIRYFQGGREGIFIIDNKTTNGVYSKNISPIKLSATTDDYLTNAIKFVPLGETGPDQILVNGKTHVVYVSLKNDNFVALIDGSNNTVQEKIILQEPRAMSIGPSTGLLYVASGDSNWFNVIDMNTHKVVSANTEIAYSIASVVNNITNQVYVTDCRFCDDYDFTNGSSIYELDSSGSTTNWKTYENVNFVENELVSNPFTNRLYAIGTDQSEMSNLYVIDLD
jgi:DNA-binding beta-propeller fold protein YncE